VTHCNSPRITAAGNIEANLHSAFDSISAGDLGVARNDRLQGYAVSIGIEIFDTNLCRDRCAYRDK